MRASSYPFRHRLCGGPHSLNLFGVQFVLKRLNQFRFSWSWMLWNDVSI
jgi:hypothetical protein